MTWQLGSFVIAGGLFCWLASLMVDRSSASPIESIATPVAVSCAAPPRSFADLQAILSVPAASPIADDHSPLIPTGTPADAATITGITATLHELIACFNAGETLRTYSLYTPAYLRTILSSQPPLTASTYDERATPRPIDPDERAVLEEIRSARRFADGSAGAYATIRYPIIPVPKTFFFTFVREDERWLIDGALGEISFSVP